MDTPIPAVPHVQRLWFTPGLAIMLMIVATLTVVAYTRFTAPPVTEQPDGHIAQARLLRFDDLPDGAVAAIDAASGTLVQRFEGEQGFLRGTLRAMMRERKLQGAGRGDPFELLLHDDGRLTLRDPSTGARIALESFGATNTLVFARLLGKR